MNADAKNVRRQINETTPKICNKISKLWIVQFPTYKTPDYKRPKIKKCKKKWTYLTSVVKVGRHFLSEESQLSWNANLEQIGLLRFIHNICFISIASNNPGEHFNVYTLPPIFPLPCRCWLLIQQHLSPFHHPGNFTVKTNAYKSWLV